MIKPAFIFVAFIMGIPFCGLSSGINASNPIVKKLSPAEMITISVTNFGVEANSFQNASPGIVKAIEYCKSKENVVLKLPGGRIDLWPEGAVKSELYISNSTEADTLSKVKSIGFWLENFHNFTIEGNNTLVVLHGKMVSFAFLNCRNILLKDISFDYQRPTMSEVTIKSVSDSIVKTEIHPDSKYHIENGRIIFYGEGWESQSFHTILFNPEKDIMQYSSFGPFLKSKATETSPLHVTFKGVFTKNKYQPGDVLTMRDPYRDNCGGFIDLSKDVRLENVKMYYMHGLGIVSQFSENILMRKVSVAPNKDSGRVIASFADCLHFSGCRGTVEIDSCFMSGAHDDPINIHGTHLQITGIDAAKKLTVRFMHHQTYGFQAFFPGDSIAFVEPQTLKPSGLARIKTARLVNLREMELEIEGVLPENVKSGLCIENLTWTPNVIIRNSRFERTNTRGLLITTRRQVLIENNTFYHIGMHAILIADDASNWFESGRVMDVTIRNNVFEDCGYNSFPGNYIIAIDPENHKLVPGYCVHHNIRIENNTFKMYDYPILSARSVENLIFTGNKIVQTNFMGKGDKRPGFILTTCSKVEVRGNTFSSDLDPTILADKMEKRDIKSNLPIIFSK